MDVRPVYSGVVLSFEADELVSLGTSGRRTLHAVESRQLFLESTETTALRYTVSIDAYFVGLERLKHPNILALAPAAHPATSRPNKSHAKLLFHALCVLECVSLSHKNKKP